jgi:hypothetical protein
MTTKKKSDKSGVTIFIPMRVVSLVNKELMALLRALKVTK